MPTARVSMRSAVIAVSPTLTILAPARAAGLLAAGLLGAGLPGAGCVEYEYARAEGVDIFYQDPAAEVDILLVVDNSCSMELYQEQLGENFLAFISFFTEANVDYHVGVLTTTVGEAKTNVQNDCAQEDVDAIAPGGHLVDGTFITSDTPDAEARFAELVALGICGSTYEMGLQSAWLAVNDPEAMAANKDFLRDEASLSLIFVSNEEDFSPYGVNTYINAFRDVKGQRSRDVFNASALVVESLDDCSTREVTAGASEGSRYLDVAKQTNGIRADICADDFSGIVTDLSLNASRLIETFYLSDLPLLSTLTVTLGEDEEIPCEQGRWTYELLSDDEGNARPAVVFDREQLPPIGEKITIRYDYGDGDPAGFCQVAGEGA